MTELIALLPMKAHSERVPGKNIKVLNGKPLFFYIADTLKATGLFQLLGINTDSEEVAALAANRYGDWVRIIERPATLVGDHVPMNAIIEHDVSLFGADHHFLQTHSTNPLLSAATIAEAVGTYSSGFRDGTLDSVFSVNEIRSRLYDSTLRPLNHDPAALIRTQDLDVIYEENSSFYIFSGQGFRGNHHRIGKKAVPFAMKRNALEGIDIDEPSDWQFVEMVCKVRDAVGA
jgi:CMP-N-acetylneuraminic acid synthetase